MADYKATDTELTTVANAIRTRGGTQSLLTWPDEFVSAIGSIPSGGGSDLNLATAGNVLVSANFNEYQGGSSFKGLDLHGTGFQRNGRGLLMPVTGFATYDLGAANTPFTAYIALEAVSPAPSGEELYAHIISCYDSNAGKTTLWTHFATGDQIEYGSNGSDTAISYTRAGKYVFAMSVNPSQSVKKATFCWGDFANGSNNGNKTIANLDRYIGFTDGGPEVGSGVSYRPLAATVYYIGITDVADDLNITRANVDLILGKIVGPIS